MNQNAYPNYQPRQEVATPYPQSTLASPQQPKAPPVPAVSLAIQTLTQLVAVLEKDIEVLEAKLQPVMTPPTPLPAPDGQRDGCCANVMIADMLLSIGARVSRITAQINSITQRTEL